MEVEANNQTLKQRKLKANNPYHPSCLRTTELHMFAPNNLELSSPLEVYCYHTHFLVFILVPFLN